MRDFLTKDLGWKLFSLALAVVIWFTIHGHDTLPSTKPLESRLTRMFPEVSVLKMSTAADVREFKVNPSVVQVTVSGRPAVVDALHNEDIHVWVDLSDIETAGDLEKRVDVSVPRGVTVERVVPDSVAVVVPPKPEE